MLKKIISGHQTGACQGALDAAIKLGIPHSGYLPKDGFSEDNPRPQAHTPKETFTSGTRRSIEQNIIDSDGTLIVSHGKITAVIKGVQDYAQKNNRPWIHVNLNQTRAFKAARMIASWIRDKKIEILNVTGPEASEDPEIYQRTMDIIESVYHLDMVDENLFNLEKELAKQQLNPPKSVDEAVKRLISELSLKDKVSIANMTFAELDSLDPTLGEDIRFEFGLWNKNEFLMDSCRLISGDTHLTPNSASKIIIDALWENLRKTHKLRIIKQR